MYILHELWRGNITPSEPCIRYGSEYSRIREQCFQIGRLISAELSDEGRKHFQEYEALRERMSAISEEDCFFNGFRIGVGLILDAAGPYESQFERYHEDD